MPTDTDAPESARLRTWVDSQDVMLSPGEEGPPIYFDDVRWALAKIQSQSAEIARLTGKRLVRVEQDGSVSLVQCENCATLTARCEALERALRSAKSQIIACHLTAGLSLDAAMENIDPKIDAALSKPTACPSCGDEREGES